MAIKGFSAKETARLRRLAKEVASGKASIDELVAFVALLLPSAVERVNLEFAPRRLVKRSRAAEPLPINKKELSSYRTRLGTVLEYALSTFLDRAVEDVFLDTLRITFAVAHDYPDFLVRDRRLGSRMRIEMKAVDLESEEQAARFDVLQALIQGEKDLVVMLGWKWHSVRVGSGALGEHPLVVSFVVVPALDLAAERDKSVALRGGHVSTKGIFVPSKGTPGTLTADKGNAGKILRLVHQSRKAEAFALSHHIQRYLQFVKAVSGGKK